jgi:hypothetical protein
MGHFENYNLENDADNLGNNPEGFIPLEDLAINPNSPDQFMMKKEEGLIVTEKAKEVFERDEEPSNWEEGVGKREFDKPYRTEVVEGEIKQPSYATRDRTRADFFEELGGEDRADYYEASRGRDTHPKEDPRGDGKSIRFDEAA